MFLYPITDLGKKDSYWNSQFSSINNARQVAGTIGSPPHAAIWTQSTGTQDLGTLDNTDPTLQSGSNAIKNNGVIVGQSDLDDPIGNWAFRWTPGFGMQFLASIYGGTYEVATDINDSDQVVGWSEAASSSHPGSGGNTQFRYAVLWTVSGAVHDLGTLGGNDAVAVGINNLGQVVGASGSPLVAAPRMHPFLWDPQNGMQDIGTLGGSDGLALGINDHGVVIGLSKIPGDVADDSFIWTSSTGMRDLGTLYGGSTWAIDINNKGEIVGTIELEDPPRTNVAFRYFNGTMYDLNDAIDKASGWRLDVATGINDHGDIVGYGQLKGELHGFLLTSQLATRRPAPRHLPLPSGPRVHHVPREAVYDPYWWIKWNPTARRTLPPETNETDKY